jgi:hypothetical protein
LLNPTVALITFSVGMIIRFESFTQWACMNYTSLSKAID